MKALVTLIFLAALNLIATSASAQVKGCLNSNPHSFACQQGTFFGKIFPLAPASQNKFIGNWRTLVFASSPVISPVFQTRFSPENPRIPTGVVNKDGTLVGSLFWPNSQDIRFHNFRTAGNHLQLARSIQIADTVTANITFFNPQEGTRELLICRVFIRNANDHLLCQWLRQQDKGFRFLGYFGFIR